MATLREAADAIINRAQAASATATAEDLVYLAKATEAVGVTSGVNFINATSEMQNTRIVTTGDEQDARVTATGDAEVARVTQTMGDAVGVLTTQGDLLVHDGTGAARVPIGTDGQALVMAGGMPVWGSGGKLVNVTHFKDNTRRAGLASNNIYWFQNLALCTKQKASSLLWITGHIPLHGGQGNNVTVPVLTVKDGTNSHEVIGFYQQFTTSEGGYLSFNAIVPESGALGAAAIQFDLYITSYNGTGNTIANTMNPTNSDDARLYPAGDPRQWVTRFTVMEFEQ
ncbi:MAG: hypothetical protein OXQ92_11330 [Boseongicola sp.]|nr:hypothetical protein [Boseongicola sp.]